VGGVGGDVRAEGIQVIINSNSMNIPLADESVHCCITSVPYWGLRDYGLAPTLWGGSLDCNHGWVESIKRGHDGGKNSPKTQTKGQVNFQTTPDSTHAFCHKCGAWRGCYGLEPTVELYVEHTVEIFREVWRVMRPDATLWLNIGDCYASSPNGMSAAKTKANGKDDRTFRDKPFSTVTRKQVPDSKNPKANIPTSGANRQPQIGLKPKDLVGMPWRVALALQADGWYLRSDVIWAKPNPMPESVTDRPMKAHEYIFLLTKSGDYYFDQEAVREKYESNSFERTNNPDDTYGMGQGGTLDCHDRSVGAQNPNGRNLRSVWTLATQPYSGAHFATFPEALPERCILAGTSARGCCPSCGAGWVREVEKLREHGLSEIGFPKTDSIEDNHNGHKRLHRRLKAARDSGESHDNALGGRMTLGWCPACNCPAAAPIPARVLDPFCGSGTTIQVARLHGRLGIGLDLSMTYLRDQALPRAEKSQTADSLRTLPLFGGR